MKAPLLAGWRLPLALLLVFAAVPLLPLGRDAGYVMLLGARIMVFATAAVSLDLILGAGGLVSFGHAAPLLLGAYAVAALDKAGVDGALPVLALALALAGTYALLTGAVALRTRGVNFIMITLAFAQMVYFATGSIPDYGGTDGYPLGERTRLFGLKVLHDGLPFYLSALAVLVASYLVCRALLATPFGRSLVALRQNEQRARAMGIDPLRVRLGAMVVASLIASLAGVLLANESDFISPAYGAWQRSAELMVMVLLGGAGSLSGAVLGAGVVVLLEEGLGRFTQHWPLIFGPVLVLAALGLRGGLAGVWSRRG